MGGPLRVPPRCPARRAGRAASPGRPAAPAEPRAGDQHHQDDEQQASSAHGVLLATIVPIVNAPSSAATALLRDRRHRPCVRALGLGAYE